MFLIIVLLASLFSYNSFGDSIDINSTSFEMKEEVHVDNMDFSGIYPLLEKIDIDAKMKKRVFLNLSGVYPKLKTLSYEGSFGVMKGVLTGDYSSLQTVSINCSTCKIDLDFSGKWEKSVIVNISNRNEMISIKMPKDIPILVKTKTSFKGKAVPGKFFTKQGRGVLEKTFVNDLAKKEMPLMVFNVETSGQGQIFLD